MVRFLTLALCVLSASAFAPSSTPIARSSALSMSQSADQEKRFAASVLSAAYIFANVVSVAPAFAAPEDFGSTQIVAAKSGGRMGGRSATGSRGSSSSYSKAPSSYSSSNRVIEKKTTIIQQPAVVQSPVVVAPPVYGGYGYGYAPDPAAVGKRL